MVRKHSPRRYRQRLLQAFQLFQGKLIEFLWPFEKSRNASIIFFGLSESDLNFRIHFEDML